MPDQPKPTPKPKARQLKHWTLADQERAARLTPGDREAALGRVIPTVRAMLVADKTKD